MMQVEDRRSGRVFLMSVAVRDCENSFLFPASSGVVGYFSSFQDNQPAHPFSFFGRPAGKILWTNGNLRLTASAGVTRNSASREDSDHKGRVKEEAGRINYIALVFLQHTE